MKDKHKKIKKQSYISLFFSYCTYFYDIRLIHLLIDEITQLKIITVYHQGDRNKMGRHLSPQGGPLNGLEKEEIEGKKWREEHKRSPRISTNPLGRYQKWYQISGQGMVHLSCSFLFVFFSTKGGKNPEEILKHILLNWGLLGSGLEGNASSLMRDSPGERTGKELREMNL